MQDPTKEISSVITLLTAAVSPDIQNAAFHKYFTPDAGFRHPLCSVTPAPDSRESLLGIYQWYRVMSPHIDIDVKSVVYDTAQNTLILDIVQTFHIFLSPFAPASSRLLVRLTLREENNLQYIAFQEDFYHPDDLTSLLIPPLAPLVRVLLCATGFASDICAKTAQVLGFWRVDGQKEV